MQLRKLSDGFGAEADEISPDFPPDSAYVRDNITDACLDIPTEGAHVMTINAVGPSGRKAYYSNYGFQVLAETTERASGIEFGQYLAEAVFEPLAIPAVVFTDPELAWAHPEYPLLLPLIFASVSAAVRDWNDHALALLYPLFQIGTALAAYGFLARRAGRAAGVIASVPTTSVPSARALRGAIFQDET